MNNFKFIHAADLHLGSILHVGEKKNKNIIEIFNNAVYRAFEKLCTIAIKEKVKFILLCGDIYDKDLRSVKANSFFVNQCEKLESEHIKVFIIGGNHDPIKDKKELFKLPSNVFVFSANNAEVIELRDESEALYCKIVGQSYKDTWDSRKVYENYFFPKHEQFTIAMLHTQLDNNNNYVPCTITELKAIDNIDYWALGHIHKAEVVSINAPVIFYPGIPQGRDFGEQGLGGAILVEVENNQLKEVSFISISTIIWKRVNVTIDNTMENAPKNLSELESIIIDKAKELMEAAEINKINFPNIYIDKCNGVEGYIVNWNLKGRGELYNFLNDKEEAEEYFRESLNNKLLRLTPFIYTNSLEFNIGRPIEDLEELKLKNNVIKAVSALAGNCVEKDIIKTKLLKELSSLWEEPDSMEDINMKRLQLDNDNIEEIISQAEQLIIELLLQRGEQHEN